jgi:hypothetical protein
MNTKPRRTFSQLAFRLAAAAAVQAPDLLSALRAARR